MGRRRVVDGPHHISYAGLNPDQVLDVYPVDFLDCRMGHDWPGRKDAGAVKWSYAGKGLIDRASSCKRCGYTKIEHFDIHWVRVDKTDTYYPPGYLTPKTGLSKTDFRAANYGDQFAEANRKGLVTGYDKEEK